MVNSDLNVRRKSLTAFRFQSAAMTKGGENVSLGFRGEKASLDGTDAE